jgi:adenylate cyclase
LQVYQCTEHGILVFFWFLFVFTFFSYTPYLLCSNPFLFSTPGCPMNERLLPLPGPFLAPELYPACLLVADLVGSTRLARRLPLHQYVTLMAELIQLLILHFEAHGAQVLQHQGDAVVCIWPGAQAERAAQAGLACHARAANLGIAALLGQTLQLRVGLAVGEVILCAVGGLPSAYGLPLNLARRLSGAALPGETLACPALPMAAPSVQLGEREVCNLTGFEDLGRVYRVLDYTAQPNLTRTRREMKIG